MDLMNASCISDYNHLTTNRSASLKMKLRTQSKSIKASRGEVAAYNERTFNGLPNHHRLSDLNNCCDNNNHTVLSSCKRVRWQKVLVFSVVVLIKIASIDCIATRQLEGELLFFLRL